jgi:uncharacterized protein (TIGR02145 family)
MIYLCQQCKAFLLVMAIIFGTAYLGNVFAQAAGTFTDKRDKKTYKTVKIGEQIWMAQNLNFKTDSGSWCYRDEDSNCGEYGRLYDWETARTACPTGWHLPTREDWGALAIAAGGPPDNYGVGGGNARKLKAASGWYGGDNGTDDFGFSALPGGERKFRGRFIGEGRTGKWWTATERDSNSAYRRMILMSFGNLGESGDEGDKSNGLSVRCVQD